MTHLKNHHFILATDLDGTFLGGDGKDRARLYDWIRSHRQDVGLIFVTGRDPDFITELCQDDDIPWPDYVVGDVGTTIARVDATQVIRPIPALETAIREAWGNLGPRLRAALEGHPGLRMQNTDFRYRISYDMDPGTFDDSAVTLVEQMGADALISDNRFFDVLPRGISKGPSLRKLLAHLDVPETRVLAAGDTLNDQSLLVAGTPAVAVGGSEKALLERLPETDRIHRATGVGAAGIIEAIAHFALHPNIKEA
ncbi:Mannosylfructose-phosphate phosphatase [Roseobacter fucihabitans]|uniref:Mannosylfructose-phosphate phosphatase n=1 Tax=Roseobacter fucihabitans TaxID=1537242 RepID=A0ABZ2C2H9_9RHOB|nr:HAD family hydrolase [Roseobacter litoralis]MBC6966591.1 Mannosylfructose-phosphate phosphatase [Roseobacter litoralis]